MILRKKRYAKYYYIKKGKKKKYYYIDNINLEENIKDIYNFLIKYLNNNIIIEVANDYHDDKCLIEEYDIFERKYNKGGNKFNYIYNDEYRRQLAFI